MLVVIPSVFGAHASTRRPHDAPPVAKAARPRPVAVATRPTSPTSPFVAVASETPGESDLAGLRSAQASGVATRPVLVAADAFFRSLPVTQQVRASVPVEALGTLDPLAPDTEARPGLRLDDLAGPGREALIELIEASLSAPGLSADEGVVRLRQVLAEPVAVDHVTLLGTPHADAAWGWQLDGRHLSVTYLVAGDVVLVTPTYLDLSAPLVAEGGLNSPSAP